MDFGKSLKQVYVPIFMSQHPQCSFPFHWKALSCYREMRWSPNAKVIDICAMRKSNYQPRGKFRIVNIYIPGNQYSSERFAYSNARKCSIAFPVGTFY